MCCSNSGKWQNSNKNTKLCQFFTKIGNILVSFRLCSVSESTKSTYFIVDCNKYIIFYLILVKLAVNKGFKRAQKWSILSIKRLQKSKFAHFRKKWPLWVQKNITMIAPVVKTPWLSLVIYENFAVFFALTGGLLNHQQRKGIFLAARECFRQLMCWITHFSNSVLKMIKSMTFIYWNISKKIIILV